LKRPNELGKSRERQDFAVGVFHAPISGCIDLGVLLIVHATSVANGLAWTVRLLTKGND
jgi:hypothetical protein